MQHTFDIVQTVAFLAAFIALASRLFVASRPFWSRLPAWAQTFLPVLVPTLTATVQGLVGVKSWGDLSVLFLVSAGMLLPGLPSNRSAAPLQAGKDPKRAPSAGDVAVAESMIAKASVRPPPSEDVVLPPNFPGAAALFLLACFASGFATSCALFSPADYAHCLPAPAGLLSDVAEILKSPDYEKRLKELALTKTEAAVICAVEQFVDLLAGKVGASPDEAVSVSRGKAFLAKAGAK